MEGKSKFQMAAKGHYRAPPEISTTPIRSIFRSGSFSGLDHSFFVGCFRPTFSNSTISGNLRCFRIFRPPQMISSMCNQCQAEGSKTLVLKLPRVVFILLCPSFSVVFRRFPSFSVDFRRFPSFSVVFRRFPHRAETDLPHFGCRVLHPSLLATGT